MDSQGDQERQVYMIRVYQKHLANILQRPVTEIEAATHWGQHLAAMYRAKHEWDSLKGGSNE